jgi:hypothetical protein
MCLWENEACFWLSECVCGKTKPIFYSADVFVGKRSLFFTQRMCLWENKAYFWFSGRVWDKMQHNSGREGYAKQKGKPAKRSPGKSCGNAFCTLF